MQKSKAGPCSEGEGRKKNWMGKTKIGMRQEKGKVENLCINVNHFGLEKLPFGNALCQTLFSALRINQFIQGWHQSSELGGCYCHSTKELIKGQRVKQLGQGHTRHKWKERNLNPGVSPSKVLVLGHYLIRLPTKWGQTHLQQVV